jgi:dihydroorotase
MARKDFDVVFIGRFFLDDGPQNCCVGVRDGRIVRIAKELDADYTLDFGHFLVLPGAVDAHVHFRDPGLTQKEDIRTGSTSAVFGGVTAVLDMPNTQPLVRTSAQLAAKAQALRDRSLVDYGLFCEAHPSTDFESAAEAAIGFKVYLAGSTGTAGFPSLDDAQMSVSRATTSGRPVTVHAEDPLLIDRSARPEDLAAHDQARPAAAEASAVRWICGRFDTRPMNLAHISSLEGLDAARIGGYSGTIETSPHHALLDRDVTGLTRQAMAKCNPPLRARADQEAVFAALRGGQIQILASDHAPHTTEEKSRTFAEAPSGVPGVETLLPLMMARVFYKQIDLQRVVDACCRAPAERFGLAKGRIAVGYDADFAVFDPRDVKRVRADTLHSKCGWTPFEGQFAVMPAAVFLRGDELMAEGEIRTARPPGQLLRPGVAPRMSKVADVPAEDHGDAGEE